MTNTAAPAPLTFEVGASYSTGSTLDYIWTFTVVKRTAKFLTLEDTATGDVKRVGTYVFDGVESAMPLGRFSLAPVIRAA